MAVKEPKDLNSSSNGGRPNRAPGSASGRSNAPYVRRSSVADDSGPLSMTGIRTGLLHSLGMKILLGGLILIFAVGFALQSIGPATNLGTGSNPAAGDPNGGPDVVARVGDEAISRAMFRRSYLQQVEMAQRFGMGDTGATGLMDIRQRAMDSLASDAAQVAEAKRRGLTVSDADIDKYINDDLDKQLKPQSGQSEASIRREIESQGKTVEQVRAAALKNADRDIAGRAVLLQKLEKAVKDETKVTEDDYKRANTKLALHQIKVSPKAAAPGAKDPKADTARGEADAKARADKLAASLKAAPLSQFVAAAKKESDDIATKAKGGDLGLKSPAELPFGDEVRTPLTKSTGTFVGPLQDPTAKDFYLFFVSGRKLDLPKDYAKNKAKLLKDFEDQQKSTAWNAFATKLAEANKPQIEDPALVAYDIQNKQLAAASPEQQKVLREQAIANYEKALEYLGGSEATAVRFHLAQLYGMAGQPDKQLATLKAATEGSHDRAVRLEYARALAGANKKDEAIKLAQDISADIDKNPSPPPQFSFGGAQGGPDDSMRFQIAGLFEQLGNKALAAKERAKVKPAAPAGMPPGMSMGGPGGIQMSSGAGGSQVINIPKSSLHGKPGGQTINMGNVKVGNGSKVITIPPQPASKQQARANPAPAQSKP